MASPAPALRFHCRSASASSCSSLRTEPDSPRRASARRVAAAHRLEKAIYQPGARDLLRPAAGTRTVAGGGTERRADGAGRGAGREEALLEHVPGEGGRRPGWRRRGCGLHGFLGGSQARHRLSGCVRDGEDPFLSFPRLPPPPASTMPASALTSTSASIWNNGERARPPATSLSKQSHQAGKPYRGRRPCGWIEVDDGGRSWWTIATATGRRPSIIPPSAFLLVFARRQRNVSLLGGIGRKQAGRGKKISGLIVAVLVINRVVSSCRVSSCRFLCC